MDKNYYIIGDYENINGKSLIYGLNISDNPFKVFDKDHLTDGYYMYSGDWIYTIKLPVDNQNLQIENICDIDRCSHCSHGEDNYGCFLTNSIIIVGSGEYLWDPDTAKKFNLQMNFFYQPIKKLCSLNDIKILNKWLNSGLKLDYDAQCIDTASQDNQLMILKWWADSGLKLKYTNTAIDMASANGFVKILQWWNDSGLKLKYTTSAMDSATKFTQLESLDWWIKSGLELKYSNRALLDSVMQDNITALSWWFNSGLKLKYNHKLIHIMVSNQKFNLLDYWKMSNFVFKYRRSVIYEICIKQPTVFEWWRINLPFLKHEEKDISQKELMIYLELYEIANR